MRTSAVATSFISTATPSTRLRSSTSPRLLRLTARNGADTPGAASRSMARVVSPPGGSILMTSAPMSASSMAQKGPAITWVWSRTRSPSSACAWSLTPEVYNGAGDGTALARAFRMDSPAWTPVLIAVAVVVLIGAAGFAGPGRARRGPRGPLRAPCARGLSRAVPAWPGRCGRGGLGGHFGAPVHAGCREPSRLGRGGSSVGGLGAISGPLYTRVVENRHGLAGGGPAVGALGAISGPLTTGVSKNGTALAGGGRAFGGLGPFWGPLHPGCSG